MKLSTKITELLKKNPGQKYTARQIAEWIYETYPKECSQKQDRSSATIIPLTSEAALINQIIAEIGSQRPRLQKKDNRIKSTESRPKLYYFSENADEDEVSQKETDYTNNSIKSHNEHALYPILREFLINERCIQSTRIDEKRSKNSQGKGGNEWLYPDMVGIEDLSENWIPEIRDCVTQCSAQKARLWSFEVKVLINRSNIRKAYFQAVSNSSWANFGYLVASEIEGDETLNELQILYGIHGIGLIYLNIENPSESQILIPAKEKRNIDWNTANRIAQENDDFSNFIKLISEFYKIGHLRPIDL